jgi:hypothetical protein
MCFSFCIKSTIDPATPDTEKFVNLDSDGWFHTCLVCGAMTSNSVIFMIFLRKDVDTRTYHACNRCKHFLRLNNHVKCTHTIRYDPHTELRICSTRISRRKVR